MLRICSRFALIVALLVGPLPALADITGKVRVIDGDTLDVGRTRIRIHGIDAPETDQPCTTLRGENWACGDWITRQVRDRFQGATARCEPLDKDRYGRVVARCFVGGTDIGKTLVQEGLAFAYRKYAMDYDLDEKAAYVAERGVHGFTIQSPARYRLTRITGRVANDPDCQIKGNISAAGKH
ncbi:MAG: thermonuclease family protein, partial [Sulfitobacter sp.]